MITTMLNNELDTSIPGRVSFHYFGKGGAAYSAKPEGQHGVELAWSLGSPAPARWEDLTHSTFDQRGQNFHCALRWKICHYRKF